MLTITQLCGLGVGGTTRPEYTLSLGACYNLELLTWVKTASGWNGVDPCKITVNIVSGAIIGATSTGSYALYVRNFPAVCELTINNYSWIVGCGGAGGSGCYVASRFTTGTAGAQGGPAIYAGSAFKFDNRGVIGAGGGGGGGGGIQSFGETYNDGSSYYVYTGTGGGGGAGTSPGAGGVGGSTSGGFFEWRGAAGGSGSLNAGGASGVGGTSSSQGFNGTNPRGGNGGGLGQAGGAGTNGVNQGNNTFPKNPALAGLPGGATNYAIYGNGNITWLNVGDIRGWIG